MMNFSIYDDMSHAIQITEKDYDILNYQNLVKCYNYVDNSGFLRPNHIYLSTFNDNYKCTYELASYYIAN